MTKADDGLLALLHVNLSRVEEEPFPLLLQSHYGIRFRDWAELARWGELLTEYAREQAREGE